MTYATHHRPRRPHARHATLAAVALLLAACTSDGMVQPPEPEPEPDPVPETTVLVLDFNYIEVIRDCDGIEGDGDFTFRVQTRPSFGSSRTVLNRSYTLGDGDRTPAIGRVTTQTTAVAGKAVTVELLAREVDQNIFIGAYNDDRMNNVTRTLDHRYTGSGWTSLGPRSMTVGSGDCQVRLHYTASEG